MPELVSLDDVQAARRRIAPRVRRTPTLPAPALGERIGTALRLKAELFQVTGSFKVRGVANALATLSAAELAQGLITLSAGNHGAALAWAATTAGSHATIVMPATAVPSKVAAVRSYGGAPILTAESLLETCTAIQQKRNLTLIHPFDDPAVIAGQGTLGLEILEDAPDCEAVVVPVGGGGLISGIAAAVKRLRPEVAVIGVEPTGADAMARSLAAGKPVRLERTQTVADGLAAPFAGENTYAHVRTLVDRVVLVDDDAIMRALRLLVEHAKLVPEPAGAAGIAALLTGATGLPPATRVVCVVSGGNVNENLLPRLLQ